MLHFKRSLISAVLAGVVCTFVQTTSAYALDFGDAGIPESASSSVEFGEIQSQPDYGAESAEQTQSVSSAESDTPEDTVRAIAGLIEQPGVTAQSTAKGQQIIAPVAVFVRYIIAVLMAIASLALLFFTAVDLLYIASPPVRRYMDGRLDDGELPNLSAGNKMGAGMYGVNPSGAAGAGGVPPTGLSSVVSPEWGFPMQTQPVPHHSHWVSDEAVAAVRNAAFLRINGSQPVETKSVIQEYLKMRMKFVVLFAICSSLLFTTLLASIGNDIGMLIVKLLGMLLKSFS